MKDAAKEAIQFCQNLRRETEIELKVLDIGGGLGISYDDPFKLPPFEAYADYVQFAGDSWRELMGTEPDLHCENGRCLSALGGFLLTQVVGTKRTSRKNFAIVDASITELIRPALYQSEHPIFYWGASSEKRSSKIFEVVGPVCESSDVLSEACSLPDLKEGDPLLIAASGAYGYVMGSFYNNRSLPPEYWIPENGEPVLSRRRVSWSEIFPETTA